MNIRPTRVHVVAALLACASGAQVLAGISGAFMLWQRIWFGVTITAAAGAALANTAPAGATGSAAPKKAR